MISRLCSLARASNTGLKSSMVATERFTTWLTIGGRTRPSSSILALGIYASLEGVLSVGTALVRMTSENPARRPVSCGRIGRGGRI